jgi:Ca2+-binding EF-hand superfamily protein
MGHKESKLKNSQQSSSSSASSNSKKSSTAQKITDLNEKDYNFLVGQTGLLKSDIKSIFDKFNAENSTGRLNKDQFVRLYQSLRPEPAETLDEISDYVFRSFDTDLNGFISFNEFLIAYALTSRGYLLSIFYIMCNKIYLKLIYFLEI